jgi:CheY-like chemotaxis protein
MTHQALIIDDNPNNADALKELLKLQGVTTLVATSPRSVFALLDASGPVDVVFLDLEFPNDSGMTALQALKADERLRSARFVAYTVHTSEQNEAHAAGFDSFIGKPLDVDHFPDHLNRILNGEGVWEI